MVHGSIMVKYKRLGLIATLLVLLSFQVVWSFGITEPLPVGLKLLRGDTQRFYFQIQAVTSPDKLACTYSISGMDPLVVNFDKDSVVVDAGEIVNIYGTISVPDTAPVKTYNSQVTVNCAPSVELKDTSGSFLQQSNVVRFNVNVVEALEERKTETIPEEQPEVSYIPTFTILVIIIAIIAIVYWFIAKRKKKK
jgi:hypothetical protein